MGQLRESAIVKPWVCDEDDGWTGDICEGEYGGTEVGSSVEEGFSSFNLFSTCLREEKKLECMKGDLLMGT